MENTAVHHIFFGRGVVTEQKEKTIRIHFERQGVGEKSFVYPDAFVNYLRFEDSSLQAQVRETLDSIRREAEERAAERAAARAALLEQEKQHQKEIAAAKRKSAAKTAARAKKKKVEVSDDEATEAGT